MWYTAIDNNFTNKGCHAMLTTTLASEQTEIEFLQAVIVEKGTKPASLIPVLQALQEKYRYISEESMVEVAKALGISAATVYGVATFYAQFSLEPKGKYVIKVCDGTACHVRGSLPVYEKIRKRVKLVDGKFTTSDGLYTVETVSCLGACGLAPVVTINDQVYGQITPEAIDLIIDALEGGSQND